MLLLLVGLPIRQADAQKKLIYHHVATDRYKVAANARYIDSLPFDGITVNSAASHQLMRPGTAVGYSAVYNALAPVRASLTRVTENFAVVFARKPADFFESWERCIQNFRSFARAARDAGMKGILFDNEEYFGGVWTYPSDVKHKSYSLEMYRRQARLRGQQIMAAMKAEWPGVQVMHLHGPYQSEARTPSHVTMGQTWRNHNDLSGSFFVGMLQEVDPARPARVIDGGEVYQYRTAADFQRSYHWRKTQQAALTPNPLIPSVVARRWAASSAIAFGVYDLPWKAGYPMSPSIMRATLTNALTRSDRYVWYYTDDDGPRDYLVPGRVGADWLQAIRSARAAVAR
jgi:hypothetical protein